MDENQEKKRVRRSAEDRIAEIDLKIEACQKVLADLEAQKGTAVDSIQKKIDREKEKIASLNAKRDAILNPKPRLTQEEKALMLFKEAKKAGLSLSEMRRRLFPDEASDKED